MSAGHDADTLSHTDITAFQHSLMRLNTNSKVFLDVDTRPTNKTANPLARSGQIITFMSCFTEIFI